MTREVRCPMPECRRRIDLDALPSEHVTEAQSCMHFIAAWGGERPSMVESTIGGLDGNREFLIRNIRPGDYSASDIDPIRAEAEAAIAYHGHVVEDVAVFGDLFERNGMSRALSQLLIGPDPIVGQSGGASMRRGR
ncbi:MAG: hypothetical protein R3C39_14490 [Dehalococcoidia bacterium]